MTGWIKLHRKLLISDMYQDLNAVQRDVLLQCLLAANHKPKKWEWQGKIFECKAGQFITSLDSLIKLCAKGTSMQNVRTALVKLEKWEFLTNESTKTGRLISVTNWDTYQNQDDETNKGINKELTKSQQSSNKELTTNKNVKKDKNEKKVSKGKTEAPESLTPTDSLLKFFEKEAYWKENQQDLIDACLDHFRSKGEKKIDWEATIRNWCRNDKKFNPKNYDSEGGITVDDSGLKFDTIEEGKAYLAEEASKRTCAGDMK